jgi:allose kinase
MPSIQRILARPVRTPTSVRSSKATIAVIEVGGTTVKFGFAVNGQPLASSHTIATSEIRTSDPIAALADSAQRSFRECGVTPVEVIATVPGLLDRDFDRVLHARNIPELNGRRMATDLSTALKMPVYLERDAILQLLGEWRAGAAIGAVHVLGIFFGTGIGAAYLSDSGVFRGGGWALEIGHMPVDAGKNSSHPASLEKFASGQTLMEIAKSFRIPIDTLFVSASRNPRLRHRLACVVRHQGLAAASALALLSPKVLLLGGGVLEMRDYPRAELARTIIEHGPAAIDIEPLDLRWAMLGWRAAIYGAVEILKRRQKKGPA